MPKFEKYPEVLSYIKQGEQGKVFSKFITDQSTQLVQLASVIEMIMKYGVSDAFSKAEVKLDDVIQEVIELTAGVIKREKVRFEYRNTIPEFTMNAERVRLYQVFINAIKNSIEAMKDSQMKELNITVHNKNKQIVVDIVDTGRGVLKNNIGDSVSGKIKETLNLGIGLSIIKGIMKEYQGKAELTSYKNKGTVLRLTQPCDK